MFKFIERLFGSKTANKIIKASLKQTSQEREEIAKSIISVLNNAKKELHHKEIYDKIKHNNYDRKKFVSLIYSLAKKCPREIKYGKKKGCFAINIRE